jgi:hypothetical protein
VVLLRILEELLPVRSGVQGRLAVRSGHAAADTLKLYFKNKILEGSRMAAVAA